MNWGGFAGGFAQGLNNGVQMGKTVRDLIRDGRIQELREKGMAEAEAQRAKSVQDMIKDNGAPGASDAPKPATQGPSAAPAPEDTGVVATPVRPQTEVVAVDLPPITRPGVGASSEGNQGEAEAAAAAAQRQPAAPSVSTQTPAPVQPESPTASITPSQAAAATPQAVASEGIVKKPSGRYTVNGESFDTREQAMAAAERSAPSATDLFMKNAVPKIAEQYLANGDPEKAKAWADYAESHNGKRAMKDWASAYTSPDFDTALTRFGKYYTDHINDGVDYVSHEIINKSDGTQVGIVTLKDKATGKEQKMEMTREAILQLGSANNPQKLFEQEVAKQREADKLKMDFKLKQQQRKQEMADKKDLETHKQALISERERAKGAEADDRESKKLSARIDTQVEALRDAGYSDDDIKRMMPALVGAGDHKKTTDPTERRALISSDLLKNDPKFARMTPEEQAKRVDDAMKVIYRDESPAASPAQATPGAANPSQAAGPIYRNNQTGERFRMINGQKVPVDSPTQAPAPAAGPAAGVPKRGGATGAW